MTVGFSSSVATARRDRDRRRVARRPKTDCALPARRLVACLALNQPRALLSRKLLAAGESWNAALSAPAAS